MQVYTYDASMDTIIQGLTVNSIIVISSEVMNGEYKDFIKFDGMWIEWQHFSRPTVESAFSNNPTKDELVTAFKIIPNHDWKHDHDFYVKNTLGTKLVLVKYRANGDIAETGLNYAFWTEILALAA